MPRSVFAWSSYSKNNQSQTIDLLDKYDGAYYSVDIEDLDKGTNYFTVTVYDYEAIGAVDHEVSFSFVLFAKEQDIMELGLYVILLGVLVSIAAIVVVVVRKRL